MTTEGRLLFESLHPLMRVSGALGGPSLESYLLARHRAIDALLERAIEEHGVTQVVEVAAGLSPRGWRFVQRYGERITYVEADLPAMAARKRRALEQIGTLGEHHRVEDLDALRDGGPASLAELAGRLRPRRRAGDHHRGPARLPGTRTPWTACGGGSRARWREFPPGRYISDLHLGERPERRPSGASGVVLSAFVRGRVYLHFDDAARGGGGAARLRASLGVGAPGVGRSSDAPSDRGTHAGAYT